MLEEMGGNGESWEDSVAKVDTLLHRGRNTVDSEEEADTDAWIIAGIDDVAAQDETNP